MVDIPGDANGDRMVDVSDLGILAAHYGSTIGAAWETGDFNADGKVDVGDLGILAAHYGIGTSGVFDFNADAKALGLTIGEDETVTKADTSAIPPPGCGSLGLFLVAVLALAAFCQNK